MKPFEKLIDDLEDLDTLLDEGPDESDADFLRDVQANVKELYDQSLKLTVQDVEAEFTEGDNEDETTD